MPAKKKTTAKKKSTTKKTSKKTTVKKTIPKPAIPKAKITMPQKTQTKKSTTKKTSKKSTKKKSTTKKTGRKPNIQRSATVNKPKSVKSNSSDVNPWTRQSTVQRKQKAVRVKPIIIIFGPEGVGKSHVLDSATKVKPKEIGLGKLSELKPCRVLDCSGKNEIVATEKFKKSFKNGDLLIIKPFYKNVVDEKGNPTFDEEGIPVLEYIENPIERVTNFRKLLEASSSIRTGCVCIDELDKVQKDAMHYTYKTYRIEKRENGELWYLPKEKYNKITKQWETSPAKECRGITSLMYTPRNDAMRDIVQAIEAIQVPVIITCHVGEKWEDNDSGGQSPSGIIFPNVIKEFRDASVFTIYMALYDDFETYKEHGVTKVRELKGRKIKVYKNGYTKGTEADLREWRKESFEMDDILDFLLEEFGG